MADIIVDPPDLMLALKLCQDKDVGLGIKHIYVVPRSHKALEGGKYEGRVIGDTIYLSKHSRKLLLHELLDLHITKYAVDPSLDLLNKLLEGYEKLIYERKEKCVEDLERLLTSNEVRKLLEDEEPSVKTPLAKVYSAKFDKEYGAYVLKIKNADPRFKDHAPITILTAKECKRGDVIPLKDLKLIPYIEVWPPGKGFYVSDSLLKKLEIPTAKKAAEEEVAKIRRMRVEAAKERLEKGYDIVLSYPKAFKVEYEQDGDIVYVTSQRPPLRFSFKPRSKDVFGEVLREVEKRSLGGLWDRLVEGGGG